MTMRMMMYMLLDSSSGTSAPDPTSNTPSR